MKDHLDDATRSRLANFVRKIGGGKLNLYAISERRPALVVLVVASCSEEALKLIRQTMLIRLTPTATSASLCG